MNRPFDPKKEECQELLARITPAPWFWQDYMESGRTLAHPQVFNDVPVHEANVLKTTDDWPATAADEKLIQWAPELLAAYLEVHLMLDIALTNAEHWNLAWHMVSDEMREKVAELKDRSEAQAADTLYWRTTAGNYEAHLKSLGEIPGIF